MIPKPVNWQQEKGSFELNAATEIYGPTDAKKEMSVLQKVLRPATGFPFSVATEKKKKGILFEKASELEKEAYRLVVEPEKIILYAADPTGWFYAVQTLRQLLPSAIFSTNPVANVKWEIPCGRMEDRPRFGWRGLMLDTARHYFSPDEIKRFLDHMAIHKLNVFHWHLVDDQGWRLEIKKYPRLTEIGAYRAESPKPGNRKEGDGTPYGGWYSQEEVREIVRYAEERHITIVPEIEMPGHSSAALAAYPELGNTDIPDYKPKVSTRWGVHPYIYAPSDAVFTFLENILLEVMELFPGEYIHIGGDEVPKEQWEQSKFAQEVMRKEGLANEEKMQHWFLARMEKFLHAHNRRLIGWDEISEGGLSETATLMLWRDWKWARAALEAGNFVVMSPTSHCYLDYSQGPIETEPEAICGELTLQKTYSFEPIPDQISVGSEVGVLGIQGNVWTEYIRDRDYLDYMTWPRAAALAEIAWSPREGRSWESFLERLETHAQRFEALGISYRNWHNDSK